MNALLLKPLSVRDPDQLAAIRAVNPERPSRSEHLSLEAFEELRASQRVFSAMFAWRGDYPMASFVANGQHFGSTLAEVTPDYFAALAVRPLLGRVLESADAGTGGNPPAPVAVIDHRCWKNRFSGDPSVLGKLVKLNGRALTIVGVTPEDFTGLVVEVVPEVTVPLGTWRPGELSNRRKMGVAITGRLKPGTSLAEARAQLEALWPRIHLSTLPDGLRAEELEAYRKRRIAVEPASLGVSYLREPRSRQVTVLMALAGTVLLIACVNLANLMAARGSARSHEIGIRLSLGAGAWRVVRLLATESLVLSLAGAAVGLVFAGWASRSLLTLTWSGYVPLMVDTSVDWRVFAFAASTALITGALLGLAPARAVLRVDTVTPLRANPRTAPGAMRSGARLLVSLQIALSMTLVVGAVLLARTLYNLRSADPGYRQDRLLLLHLFPQLGTEPIPNRTAYYRQLAEQLGGLPGVESVTYSQGAPVRPNEWYEPVSAAKGSRSAEAVVDRIGPDFFRAMGMRVISGREFDWGDDERRPPVAVVSESLARRLFADEDAVGQPIRLSGAPNGAAIVGVVSDASLWSPRSVRPAAAYLALMQQPAANSPMADLRVSGDESALAATARRVVESSGHHYPIRIQTLRQRTDAALSGEWSIAALSVFFACLALLLASIGIYGLMSYSISRRTAEIGLRMALGAGPRDVLRLVMSGALWLLLVGVGIGIPAALAGSRFLSGILFRVPERDPVAISVAVAMLSLVTLWAAYIPARRASRIDPVEALRSQ